jgi:hypothetical protein
VRSLREDHQAIRTERAETKAASAKSDARNH